MFPTLNSTPAWESGSTGIAFNDHQRLHLDWRDREFCDLAATFPDVEYDGMDVGPVGGEARK